MALGFDAKGVLGSGDMGLSIPPLQQTTMKDSGMAFSLPPLNLSASSSAKSGDIFGGTFYSAPINFGGGAGGGFDVGALISQYWPLLAVGGLIWIQLKKRQ